MIFIFVPKCLANVNYLRFNPKNQLRRKKIKVNTKLREPRKPQNCKVATSDPSTR